MSRKTAVRWMAGMVSAGACVPLMMLSAGPALAEYQAMSVPITSDAGGVTGQVGYRCSSGDPDHAGIDISADTGDPVYAAYGGVLQRLSNPGGYGTYVAITHQAGYQTVYGHLSGYVASAPDGAQVQKGQLIGYAGSTGESTGPHLHFEVRLNGVSQSGINASFPCFSQTTAGTPINWTFPGLPSGGGGAASVSGDADADLLVHSTSGVVQLRQNITRADGSHYFNDGPTLTQGWGNFLGQPGQGRLYFADVTGDGDTDLLVHNTSGLVQLRQNITRADGSHYFNDGPTLTQGWGNFLGQSGQGRLYFADVTGDGDADLLVHNTSGLVQLRQNITRADGSHYFNDGPTLTQGWGNFLGQSGQGRLYFADVTGDGDADLLVHNTSGLVQLRQNITRADGSHYFNDGPTLTQGWGNFLGQSGQGRLYFADVTGDGDADLLVHNTSGVVQLRQNITRADGSHYFNDGPTATQGWGNFLGQAGQGVLYFG